MRRGYTLIELLIVLGIIALMLGIFNWQHMEVVKERAMGQFMFDEICQSINLSQDTAIAKSTLVEVDFSSRDDAVIIKEMGWPKKRIQMVASWQILGQERFIFQSDGRINQFDTVVFKNLKTQEKRYLVFQLGSGKFVIK